MCKKNTSIINRTHNGSISQCKSCSKFNISYKNIFLELSKNELDNFKTYINQTDVNYWCEEYRDISTKAIPIPTMQNNLLLVFNREEFIELKRLINYQNKFRFTQLSFNEIKDSICEN
tara:strand:- start:537 stop:890 length:354 start_codon:yes stop_codon:yes gene_type:complete